MKYLIGFFPVGKQIPMKNSAQHIIEILFGREKLEDVTVNQLKDLVKEYPSFNIGHYLLSKKLQAENHEEFLPETKKTALYINNPFWLQWLLQQVNDEPISYPHAGQQFVHQKGTDNYIYQDEPVDLLVKPPVSAQPEQSVELPSESTNLDQVQESIRPSAEPANFLQAEQIVEETLETTVFEQTEQILEETPEASVFEQPEQMVEETLESSTFEQPGQILDRTPETSFFEQPEQIVEQTLETSVFEQPGNIVEKAIEIPGFEQPEQIEDQTLEPAHFDQFDPEIVQPGETGIQENSMQFVKPEEDSEDKMAKTEEILPEPIVSVETSPGAMSEPSSDQRAFVGEKRVIQPVKMEEAKLEEIAFDPYHTIDYFASQGIKFVPEENPSDKLGKQLKSFTDWLKIMKRLPKKAFEEITDETREADIEIIAAHSIEEKDVITEAMAAVLAKQGKNEKAIEIYQKLSLLDPGKSHYFATKIEELKIPN
jgi:hypothetical protein